MLAFMRKLPWKPRGDRNSVHLLGLSTETKKNAILTPQWCLHAHAAALTMDRVV